MAKQKYSVKNLKENQAKAIAKDASVSTKTSIETVKFLKGKTTKIAIAYLEKVLEKKLAVPYKRFTDGVGHRKGSGITSGRYPQKLSKALILLIKNVETNASMKGLGEELRIVSFVANRASIPMHYGRHPRREMKRTHIEIIVEEIESTKKKPIAKKQKVAEKSKVEVKKVETVKPQPKVVKTEEKKVVEPKPIEKQKVEVKKEETKAVEPKVEAKVPVEKVEVKKELPKTEAPNIKQENQEDKK